MKDKILWTFIAVFVTATAVFFKDAIVWAGWVGREAQERQQVTLEKVAETLEKVEKNVSSNEKRVLLQEEMAEIQYKTLRDLIMIMNNKKQETK